MHGQLQPGVLSALRKFDDLRCGQGDFAAVVAVAMRIWSRERSARR
jgi:hypothetical protein